MIAAAIIAAGLTAIAAGITVAIISRIGGDPLGLILTAVFLGALWTFVEWGIARASASKIERPE